ncbi:TPA: hypothetical protein ACK8Z3_002346 [Legionella pneumophila]|uniref:hypothetical protein n=1 Tax=Legionella pneumophila TaxID=446 RepID=UPI000317DA4A|nr:hypothetical protein [Legionella pneumophila]ERH42851.1 hypothetical protein N750_02185 [Legionella pneumophila str. Leg01/53]ERH43876.1 hypothetical protein N751_14785 [Legionella pneumophila str. Leg01/11]ERI47284.1 hypothetical protein N749_14655 [Legionella pneumophila str. Leg01/20]ERB41350.1 hypothetical protein N748_09230 [Legionella pneumophila str. 121004]MCW8393114.1 hypothetical protein [Legionella pneumophila]
MQPGRFIAMTAIYTIMLLSKSTIAGTAGEAALASSHWNGGVNLQVVSKYPCFLFP